MTRLGRRALLRGGGLAAAALLLGGHTPYRQWVVYREKHLLIGCHRGDPATYAFAQAIVAALGTALPAASARVARAPHPERLASLLGTDQLQSAVLAPADAAAMRAGAGRFAPYGELPLALLAPVVDRLLVARADFPADHAELVTDALLETGLAQASTPPDATDLPPWHPGSRHALEAHDDG